VLQEHTAGDQPLSSPEDGADPFTVGSTVVQRNVLDGRVMSALPCRVLATGP
jgi:hypothetical protein